MGRLRTGVARMAFRRTEQEVWRGSFDINDKRAQVGRPFGDGSVDQSHRAITAIVEALGDWAEEIKEEGKAHTLTRNVICTFEKTLRNLMDFKTGACEATYEMIQKVAKFGRKTVIQHMKILRGLKCFDWVRRTERTGNKPTEGPQVKQAPNAYFFEISTLPAALQIHLRQKLKRMKVKIAEHRDRTGSGQVPNRAQRLASRVMGAFAGAFGRKRGGDEINDLMAEAAFIRGEREFFGDIPVEQWAVLSHPDDPEAQRAYNARIGFYGNQTASIEIVLQSRPEEQE